MNLPRHICHSNFLCGLSLCVFFTYDSLERCHGLSLKLDTGSLYQIYAFRPFGSFIY